MEVEYNSVIKVFISRSTRTRLIKNKIVCSMLVLAVPCVLVPLASIFTYVLIQGLPGINWDFFTSIPKPVGEAGGGMANALLGSAMLIFIAFMVGVPWGVGIGIYLSEYGSSKITGLVRFTTDLLASIPSIVIGLFVYTVLVVPFRGFSAMAGGIALSIIVIPTVARTTEELLKMVPNHMREAGLALGIPRWRVILSIIVKGSKKGIVTGIILALARAAGETAPLLFTSFNNRYWSISFSEPVSAIPVQIFTYAISPFDDWHQQAWTGALMLVIFVFLINGMTRILMRQSRIFSKT